MTEYTYKLNSEQVAELQRAKKLINEASAICDQISENLQSQACDNNDIGPEGYLITPKISDILMGVVGACEYNAISGINEACLVAEIIT